MDCAKIGRLIAQLRKEKGLTQRNIADALNIGNKAVSKWECGLGCPDVALWPELSVILGVDMAQMMEGEINRNRPDAGNLSRVQFYVCPSCANAMFSTGKASIFCCGRKLEPLLPAQNAHAPGITVAYVDAEFYVAIDHAMERDHCILFAAYVKNDKLIFTRLYPEQSAEVRIPPVNGGKLYLYCVRHGLSVHPILWNRAGGRDGNGGNGDGTGAGGDDL